MTVSQLQIHPPVHCFMIGHCKPHFCFTSGIPVGLCQKGELERGCKVGGRRSSPIIPLASCRHPVSFLFLAARAQSCLSTSEVVVWSSNISCIQVSVSPSNFRTCFVVLCQKHQHQLGVGPSSEVSTLHVPSSTLRTTNSRRKGPPPQRAEFQL